VLEPVASSVTSAVPAPDGETNEGTPRGDAMAHPDGTPLHDHLQLKPPEATVTVGTLVPDMVDGNLSAVAAVPAPAGLSKGDKGWVRT
jgi:hypothetical protein